MMTNALSIIVLGLCMSEIFRIFVVGKFYFYNYE